MRFRTRIIAFAALFAIAVSAIADEPEENADDTATVLALSQYGAQMDLREGRIIGLRLEGERIDDDVLKLLANLPQLQSLSLDGAAVTGEGLAHLEKLPRMHSLMLVNTPVDDRDVKALAAIGSVNSYVLRGTKISGMGWQRLESLLKKAKRDAVVSFHRGGFLGVTGSFGLGECVIGGVVADSAAAKAGLEVGDVILEFDGQEIGDFQRLADVVGLSPVEEPVIIKVRRGTEKINKTVTLTRGQPPTQRE